MCVVRANESHSLNPMFISVHSFYKVKISIINVKDATRNEIHQNSAALANYPMHHIVNYYWNKKKSITDLFDQQKNYNN